MKPIYVKLTALGAAASMLGLGAVAEGDATRGETVFKQCATCHAMNSAQKKMGPHLGDLIGRTAGSLEGANYSKAMTESGIVWDDATLREFLANPRKALPGTTMPIGLAKAADMDDLIAYLSAGSGE